MEEVKKKKTTKTRTPVTPVVYPAQPTNASEIDMQFMFDYCKAKKKGSWLKAEIQKTAVGKDGKERRYGMFQVRKEFVTEFFPELEGTKPAAKDSWFKKIMDLED